VAGAEAGQRALVDEVRRRFGDDDVARVDQGLAEQVQQLLRAGRDEHVIDGEGQFAGREVVEGGGAAEELVAQGGVALGGAVLQRGAGAGRVGEDLSLKTSLTSSAGSDSLSTRPAARLMRWGFSTACRMK